MTRMVLIQKDADLHQYPHIDLEHTAAPNFQFTIGDLHGNALKLVYFLVRQQILELKNGAEDYALLHGIYLKDADELIKEDLAAFNCIIGNAKVINHPRIRFIGDELADRGQNDYFTLKLIEKLVNNNVPLEVILSNHGMEFLYVYEKEFSDFETLRIRNDQKVSLKNLGKLLSKKLVEISEINKIVESCYLPNLKIVSYSIDAASPAITLYTHAPVGMPTIKSLAEKCSVTYSRKSISALAKVIENINEMFLKIVAKKELYQFSELTKVEVLAHAPTELPLVRVIWHRTEKYLIPGIKYGYKTFFVHGHNKRGEVGPDYIEHVINLDNLLGKAGEYHGTYTILYSDECTLSEMNTKINPIKVAMK